MFNYLFYFILIGMVLTFALVIILLVLYIISLFSKNKKLVKIVKIIKTIFIISIIIVAAIITFSLIFDSFIKNDISNKAKDYISNEYNVPLNDIEVLSYTKGSVAGLCIDSCHSKPYRIMIKTNDSNYCVNAYDLSNKYIYPTKLHWSNEKSNNNTCEEIDYDSYYDLDIDK